MVRVRFLSATSEEAGDKLMNLIATRMSLASVLANPRSMQVERSVFTLRSLPTRSCSGDFLFVGRACTRHVGGQKQMKVLGSVERSQEPDERFEGSLSIRFEALKCPKWDVC